MPITLPFSSEEQLLQLERKVGEAHNTYHLTKVPVPARLMAHLVNELHLAAASQRRSPTKLEANVYKSISTMLADLKAKGAVARA